MQNTRIPGHGLYYEGRPAGRTRDDRVRCLCGETSDPGLTQAAARRWIADHKNDVTSGYWTPPAQTEVVGSD